MDSYIRPLAVITGDSIGIGTHGAKRCTETGFDLVVAVPGVSVDYVKAPALRTWVAVA